MKVCPLLWMAGLAGSHFSLSVYQGLSDGDYSLAWFALPFAALTLAGGVTMLAPRPWAAAVSVGLSALTVVLALLSLAFYLLGLFHLLQAVVATGYSLRESARRGAAGGSVQIPT